MKYCFGGVLICKTKEQAKRVAFDHSVRKKVITLEGDVYDPAGERTVCVCVCGFTRFTRFLQGLIIIIARLSPGVIIYNNIY